MYHQMQGLNKGIDAKLAALRDEADLERQANPHPPPCPPSTSPEPGPGWQAKVQAQHRQRELEVQLEEMRVASHAKNSTGVS